MKKLETTSRLCEDLFAWFDLYLPGRVNAAWPNEKLVDDAKQAYMNEWKGLTKRQIQAGVEKMRKDKPRFLPSPFEFSAYCQPSPGEYGMPSPDEAWLEVQEKAHSMMFGNHRIEFSHRAVKEAARGIWSNILNYNHKTDKHIREGFLRSYRRVIDKVMLGDEILVDNEIQRLEDRSDTESKQEDYGNFQVQQAMEKQGIDKNSGNSSRDKLKAMFNIG